MCSDTVLCSPLLDSEALPALPTSGVSDYIKYPWQLPTYDTWFDYLILFRIVYRASDADYVAFCNEAGRGHQAISASHRENYNCVWVAHR